LRDEKLKLGKYLTELNTKLSRARELLLSGDLDGPDDRLIKIECENQIKLSEARIGALIMNKYSVSKLEIIVNEAVSTLSNLNIIYNNEGIEDKRRIIGSIFRKKFTF